MEIPFVKEICQLLATNSSGRFTFGSGNTNLKIGEIIRNVDGVYAIPVPTIAPDKETEVEYYQIDFWRRCKDSATGYDDLQFIQRYFHQKKHYETDNYQVYLSLATSQIQDLDRDAEGGKLLRTSIFFITRYLIS